MADGTVKLVSEKVKDHLSLFQGLMDFISEKTNETLPLVKSSLDLSVEKLKESRPLMKNSVNYLGERVSEADLNAKRFMGFVEQKGREGLPWVKFFVNFSIEKIKQHPYLAVMVPLIGLWMYKGKCRSPVTLPTKMMKAPGRNFRMPRIDFEKSPKNYFRDLRGK